MGMFDYVCSEMPLPVGGGRRHIFGREHQFQTKDFDREFGGNLDRLIISVDGFLRAAYVDDEGFVDYDEESDPTDFTGMLQFYGELVKLERETIENRHLRGWGEWEAEVAQGRILAIKMRVWRDWEVPEGFPPTPREELYERALEVIIKGTAPPGGVGLHYYEITVVAQEVLVGETEHLELYEKELLKRGEGG